MTSGDVLPPAREAITIHRAGDQSMVLSWPQESLIYADLLETIKGGGIDGLELAQGTFLTITVDNGSATYRLRPSEQEGVAIPMSLVTVHSLNVAPAQPEPGDSGSPDGPVSQQGDNIITDHGFRAAQDGGQCVTCGYSPASHQSLAVPTVEGEAADA